MAARAQLRLNEGDEGETERMYICIYIKLGLNKQVAFIYCASNIYLKFFLCATILRKWHIYEIVTLFNY